MKNYIIGIAGELNSGKDTLASMINHIFNVGVAKANYQYWLINREKWDLANADRITHFADPLKDCLSIMYNIPREYFDNRQYKDGFFYHLTWRIFVNENSFKTLENIIIDIETIKSHQNNLDSNINWIIQKGFQPIIKLRTLMQYFGTEIGRNMLQDNLWINATMGRAADIAETRRLCLIPDIRFTNERDAIRGNSLYGGDILIKRESSDQTKHASETIDFTCKYTVNNSGTKMQTFYQAINIVSEIIKT